MGSTMQWSEETTLCIPIWRSTKELWQKRVPVSRQRDGEWIRIWAIVSDAGPVGLCGRWSSRHEELAGFQVQCIVLSPIGFHPALPSSALNQPQWTQSYRSEQCHVNMSIQWDVFSCDWSQWWNFVKSWLKSITCQISTHGRLSRWTHRRKCRLWTHIWSESREQLLWVFSGTPHVVSRHSRQRHLESPSVIVSSIRCA